MEKRLFGTYDGHKIYAYTISNGECCAEFITLGATVTRFCPYGVDIVGGFDSIEGYINDRSFQGATVGRVCNRIEDATLTMDGAVYMLTANDGDRGNCLHGGSGFHKKIWEVTEEGENSVTMTYTSPDGEDGFPATVTATARFTLKDACLVIEYDAIPDAKTPIAMTNHSFFNLDGFGGTVFDHKATIYADRYSVVNKKLIPTGEQPEVVGTQFDFNKSHTFGERLDENLKSYDHNYFLSPKVYREFCGKKIGLCAVIESNGLELSFYTNQPCMQLYTGGFLGSGKFGDAGKFRGGIAPVRYGAFCLEAQTEPNCVNHGEAIYDAGEKYSNIIVYEVKKI